MNFTSRLGHSACPVFVCIAYVCLVAPAVSHAEGLLSIDNPAKNGPTTGIYTTVQAFEGNDSVAMRQYGGTWQGSYSPRSGTNLGLQSARVESGVQWQGYRLGTLYRAEALVEASRDTSDLVRQNLNSAGYDAGRIYPLAYQLKGFDAGGVRLSKSWGLPLAATWQVTGGLGLAYLQGQRLKLQTASGQVITVNAKDINASVALSTTDSTINVRDLAAFNAPFGRFAKPSGEGYAVDAGLLLQHGPSGISLEVALADLAGSMTWKDVPNNAETYNNATKFFDANGYVNFNPTATRTSQYQNLNQVLDPKLWLAVNLPLGDFALQAAASTTRGYWFPELKFTYLVNPTWRLAAHYDTYFKTLGLSIEHPWLTLSLRAGSLNPDSAKAFGFSGEVHVPF